jgi:nitrate reductase assembly molybdenum cofactor insertion protein NarJ
LVVHVPSRSDALLLLLVPTAVNRRPRKKYVAIMLFSYPREEKRFNAKERERQIAESERNASKGATQAALEGWSTQELPRYVPLALPIKQVNRHANHPPKHVRLPSHAASATRLVGEAP